MDLFLWGVIAAATVYFAIYNLLINILFKKLSPKEVAGANILGIFCAGAITAIPLFANTIQYLGNAPVDWLIAALGDTPAYLKFPLTLLLAFTPVFLLSLCTALLLIWLYQKHKK